MVLASLDGIEAEMKNIGLWDIDPPTFQVNNYLEAPSFELWLQCVFIPNARSAAISNEYPAISQVGLMAMREYNYHSQQKSALNLVKLLRDFDTLAIDE